MKKYTIFTLVTILVLSFFISGCSSSKKEKTDLERIVERGYIIIGVKTDSPPFGYFDSKNELKGLDIELAKAIGWAIFDEKNPINIKFVPVTPENRISKLNSREVDILVATMSVNGKRKLVVDFSTPYFVTSQKMMVRNNSNITSLSHFNKKGKVAVVVGTTGEKIIRLIVPNAQVIGAKTYLQAFSFLLSKKVDAIFADDCILKGLDKSGKFKIINRAYSQEVYAVAVRKSKNSKEMLNLINSVILSLLDKKQLTLP